MENELIQIELSNDEYNYIKDILNEFYKGLSKLPKKMRSPRFYIIENLINTKFNK